MFFITTFLLFFSSFVKDPAPATRPISLFTSVPSTVDRAVLLQLVNEARSKGVQCNGVTYLPVGPLTWNEQLEAAAYYHSLDMHKKTYFSHIEADGSRANTRIEKQGYTWRAYGENIGYGYLSEKEVVEAWLKSPGHCKNIMNGNFTEMGVARSGDYWTQNLGARK